MTVQRSNLTKLVHSWAVVSGRSLSSSQICLRTGLASALNTGSRSSPIDMLCFYNISVGDSSPDVDWEIA